MTKPDRDSIVRADVLTEQREALVRKIAEADIDILVLERTDPDLPVAEQVNTNAAGQEVSRTPITARQMLDKKRSALAGYDARLEAVKILSEGV